jgi:hypothetical protein
VPTAASGRLDLRAERFDTNEARCVRPKRDEVLGLGAQLDVTYVR